MYPITAAPTTGGTYFQAAQVGLENIAEEGASAESALRLNNNIFDNGGSQNDVAQTMIADPKTVATGVNAYADSLIKWGNFAFLDDATGSKVNQVMYSKGKVVSVDVPVVAACSCGSGASAGARKLL